MIRLKFKTRLCNVKPLTNEQKQVVNDAAAGNLMQVVRRHLRGNGGRSFWEEAASSLRTASRDGKATLDITKRGVALRFFGGVVKPAGNISEMTGKPTKSLLIPSRELRQDGGDLYDNVRDPRRVHVIKNKAGRVYLVEDGEGGEKMRLLGRLVKSTTHKPNPRVLPTREEMRQAARAGAEHELHRLDLFIKIE